MTPKSLNAKMRVESHGDRMLSARDKKAYGKYIWYRYFDSS